MIADALKVNTTLEQLGLSKNPLINAQGAKVIADALKVNKLIHIDLSSNNLPPKTIKAIELQEKENMKNIENISPPLKRPRYFYPKSQP